MWIKICGITAPSDARMIAASGASAIGLNFYSKSKRFVSPDQAVSIRKVIPREVSAVGVFVNSPPEKVAEIVRTVDLDIVQFHGDESADQIAIFRSLCPDVPIIRAIRIGTDGIDKLNVTLTDLSAANVSLYAILVDALVDGEFGGTGHRVAVKQFQQADRSSWPPLILAGGLTPENVHDAIQQVRPWGVDTASGVEESPGRKSEEHVRAFVASAKM